MNWLQLVALLICPLMMLFCMKGMFTHNKDKHTTSDHQQDLSPEWQSLQIKIAELTEKNDNLEKEIQALKENRAL